MNNSLYLSLSKNAALSEERSEVKFTKLKLVISTKRFLDSMKSANIQLSDLTDRDRMKNILSESDFIICDRIHSWYENLTSVDHISGFSWVIPEHFGAHIGECEYDKELLHKDYEGGVFTYPVFFECDNTRQVYVYLVQCSEANLNKAFKGWHQFYDKLMSIGFTASDLAVNKTFNFYIYMTDGNTSLGQ